MGIFDKIKKGIAGKPKLDASVNQSGQSVKAEEKAKPTPKAKKQESSVGGQKVTAVKKSKRPPANFGVLIKPMVTEKATDLTQFNKYVFQVSKRANKVQIVQAIEDRYQVKPIKINILNNSGKVVRYGRATGRTKSWKKAIVTLPKGKTIKIHEGV